MTTIAEVSIKMLPTADGGRTLPVFAGYRPHFRVHGGNGEYLGVLFTDGPDCPIQPGTSAFVTVSFFYAPEVDYSSLAMGAEFDIMEGGKRVGVGRVTRIQNSN